MNNEVYKRGVLKWVNLEVDSCVQKPKLVLYDQVNLCCYSGFGAMVLLNLLSESITVDTESRSCYSRTNNFYEVLVIPRFKDPRAPLYKPINQGNHNILIASLPYHDIYCDKQGTQISPNIICLSNGLILECPSDRELEDVEGIGKPICCPTNFGEIRECEKFYQMTNNSTLFCRHDPPEIYAIKVTNNTFLIGLQNELNYQYEEDPDAEIHAMHLIKMRRCLENNNELNPSHLLQLHDAYQDGDNLYAVLPYIRGGSLCRLINNRYTDGIPESLARKIFKDIVKGLFELKSLSIAHLDISLANILINYDDKSEDIFGDAFIIDFGMCQEITSSIINDDGTITPNSMLEFEKSNCESGKIQYRPPEYFQQSLLINERIRQFSNNILMNHPNQPIIGVQSIVRNDEIHFNIQSANGNYNSVHIIPENLLIVLVDGYAVDIWMLGMTLFFMLTGERFIGNYNYIHTNFQSRNDGNQPFQSFEWMRMESPLLFDLLSRMLHTNPQQRLSITDVLNHSWLKDD